MSYIIGISGGSGSGKTSFIKQLEQFFNSQEITIISQDDYYKPREMQKVDNQGVHNFDLPRSIYLKEFYNDIKSLTEGQTITRQEYAFNNELVKPKLLSFVPAPIIIVEGLFIFHNKKIKKLLDLKILIEAKMSDKIIRRILRDQKERNYPIDDVLYRYKHHVLPAYEKYITPYEEEVDIIINNHENFDTGLAVISGFIQNKLSK